MTLIQFSAEKEISVHWTFTSINSFFVQKLLENNQDDCSLNKLSAFRANNVAGGLPQITTVLPNSIQTLLLPRDSRLTVHQFDESHGADGKFLKLALINGRCYEVPQWKWILPHPRRLVKSRFQDEVGPQPIKVRDFCLANICNSVTLRHVLQGTMQ